MLAKPSTVEIVPSSVKLRSCPVDHQAAFWSSFWPEALTFWVNDASSAQPGAVLMAPVAFAAQPPTERPALHIGRWIEVKGLILRRIYCVSL